MKIKLLKIIDSLFGVIATLCLPSASIAPFSGLKHILLIRPGGIGDAALIAPLINSIKKLSPDSNISILSERRNCGVFLLTSQSDTVLCYDRPGELIQALRGRYDVVIDTEQSHRLSAVVARLVRSPVKIGFDTNERRRMFTHCVPYDLDSYETENFVSLLKPIGVDSTLDIRTVNLSIPLQQVTKANQLLQPLNSDSFVVIFSGASIPEKRWGADRFRRVAEMLNAFGIKIVVVGGKEDRQHGELITAGGLGLNLAGLTSLVETAAVIQRSSLLLSGDSGVLHIAVCLGVPTVSLFGPGKVSKWAPRGERHIVINKELPCSPCTTFGTTPPCPINVRCMRDITVEEVANSVVTLLSRVGDVPS